MILGMVILEDGAIILMHIMVELLMGIIVVTVMVVMATEDLITVMADIMVDTIISLVLGIARYMFIQPIMEETMVEDIGRIKVK